MDTYNELKKLRRRIGNTVRVFRWLVVNIMKRTTKLGATREEVVDALQKRNMDREQWRRWYKANIKHQRRLTAMKRLRGGKIPPGITGLPRWVVP